MRQDSQLALAVLSKGGTGWSALETTSSAVLLEVAQEACACTGIDPLKQAVYQAGAPTGIDGPVRG